MKKENEILEDHGDWILIDISTPRHPLATSKIDRADFDMFVGRISIGWCDYPSVELNGKRKHVHKHLYPDWRCTDHINHDRTDNRRLNLRRATRSQNQMNQKTRSDNKSGIRGVFWSKTRKKWKAHICVAGNKQSLGYFDDIELAKAARLAEERKQFGEYSPNSISP